MGLVSLLQMEDRAAAAFGLENRSPFLDHPIIDFALCLPSDMKARDCTLKWILRQVAARYLPTRRGQFDRQFYNEQCMRVWREVFFAADGPLGRG